ncbi:hypothetical protein ABK040_010837 [Willaertia magna]
MSNLRPRKPIVVDSSLPNVVDYSSSGISDEDNVFFDSESYLSSDAGIDKNSTLLRRGRVKQVEQPIVISHNNENVDHNRHQQVNHHHPVNTVKKLRKKSAQTKQEETLQKSLKEVHDSSKQLSTMDLEEYKDLFVVPYEAFFTTERYKRVIEPALKEFEDNLYIIPKDQKKIKLFKEYTPQERFKKCIDKKFKDTLLRQYDATFISILEKLLIPFLNSRKEETIQTTKEEEEEATTEISEQLKGNFIVLKLNDKYRRHICHAVCQYYGLKCFPVDFQEGIATVISKRRSMVEKNEYPTKWVDGELLSTFIKQMKSNQSQMDYSKYFGNLEENEVDLVDKKSFVKHYRKKKKKTATIDDTTNASDDEKDE